MAADLGGISIAAGRHIGADLTQQFPPANRHLRRLDWPLRDSPVRRALGFALNTEQAEKFAEEWISAWNNHDLDQILSHYEDDFEMSSPVIVEAMNEPSGTLKGKKVISEMGARSS